MGLHKPLLFRRTKADKEYIGAGTVDSFHYRAFIFKVAVCHTTDLQIWAASQHILCCQLCYTGFAAQ